MTKSRILITIAFIVYGTAMLVPSGYPQLFPHHHAPTWLRYTTAGVLAVPLVPVAALIALGIARRLVRCFRSRRAIRELPAPTGIQVLGTFLRDDLHTFFERKYDIVRRIHGDDNASRLTREQIEAEYDRYDRAETAASEDRCQGCDPEPTTATCLVEAWTEQRHIGQWLLCSDHAAAKVAAMQATGASTAVDDWSVDEPAVGGNAR